MEHPYRQALVRLPLKIREVLQRVPPEIMESVTEVRLRAERPAVLVLPYASLFVERDGRCVKNQTDHALFCSTAMLKECFLGLCGHSVYAYEDSLSQGYFTLPGGHRVGIAGRSLRQAGRTAGVQDVTSLNIRIARTGLLALHESLRPLLEKSCPRILVLGAPGTGKTTLLRAMTVRLSTLGRRVTVVDERMELWPVSEDGFAALPPLHCDVLSGYLKGEGMQLALRSLSPEILVCDEIGTHEDAASIEASLHAGTGVLASAHAASVEDLWHRPQLYYMLKEFFFDDIVLLQGRGKPGEIEGVYHAADILQSIRRDIRGTMQPWRGDAVCRQAGFTPEGCAGCCGAFTGDAKEFAV